MANFTITLLYIIQRTANKLSVLQLAQKRGISRFKQYKVYVFKKTCLMPFVTVTENNTLCFKLFLFKRSAFLNRQQSKHSLVPLAASKNGRPSSCTFGVTVISSILIFGVDEIITHPEGSCPLYPDKTAARCVVDSFLFKQPATKL